MFSINLPRVEPRQHRRVCGVVAGVGAGTTIPYIGSIANAHNVLQLLSKNAIFSVRFAYFGSNGNACCLYRIYCECAFAHARNHD